MRRHFCISVFALLLCAGYVSASSLFFEDFNDTTFPPTDWTVYQLGTAPQWMRSTPGADGTGGCAYHNWSTEGMADGWLVTPAIDLTTGADGYELRFLHIIGFPAWYDASSVHVSTNSANPADGDFIELVDVGITDIAWTPRTINLTPYAGSTVYIAFRYEGDDAHVWRVDDVEVVEINPSVDLTPGTQSQAATPGGTASFTIALENNTLQDDTFALIYEDSLWVSFGPAVTELIPVGVSTSFVCNIDIPDDALAGIASTTTVMAVNMSDNAVTGTAHIIAICTWSTALLCEGFDDVAFPPAGWTVYQEGTAPQWTRATPGYDGTSGCAYHNYSAAGNMADGWLVTPQIDLTGGADKYTLQFYHYISFAAFYDASTVLISDGSPDPTDGDYVVLVDVGNTDTTWRQREIDLTPYAGTDVYIAFRYQGDDAHAWRVDNVCVYAIETGISNLVLSAPATIAITSYETTPTITAELRIDGETGAAGPASDVDVEIGYGWQGVPIASWNWKPATYDSSDADSDFYTADFTITEAGQMYYAVRARKGAANWVYGDLDGSHSFDLARAGVMTVAMQPPQGEQIYVQTIGFPPTQSLVNYSNATVGVNARMVDDITSNVELTVRTIRWGGRYHAGVVRGGEQGFQFTIYANDTSGGGDAPGAPLYTQFSPGYNSEYPTNNTFYYTLDLDTPFVCEVGETYWLGVQLVTEGGRWNVGMTADPVRGNESMIKAPAFGVDEFTPLSALAIAAQDIGFALYGDRQEGVYFEPEEQTQRARVGTVATYTQAILNHTDVTNTYALHYDSAWSVSGPADSGELLPGTDTNFVVEVTVPGLIPPGVVVTTRVTAVGIDDPRFTNTCLLITVSTWEDALYCQNFDGAFPPTGWILYQLDDPPQGWQTATPGADGTGSCAYHHYYDAASDNWLVSPPITLTPGYAGYLLRFYNWIRFAAWYDTSHLMISTGSADPADGDYTLLLDVGATDTSWTQRTVDLTPWVGEVVHIAFRYVGDDAHAWAVDDVCVLGTTPPPLGTFEGTITAAHDGSPLHNAHIHMYDANGAWDAWSAADGTYTHDVPTGTYSFVVAAQNFVTQTLDAVTVEEGMTEVVNFAMVGSVVTVTPETLHQVMGIGMVHTTEVVVVNSGPLDVTVSLALRNLTEPVVPILPRIPPAPPTPTSSEPQEHTRASYSSMPIAQEYVPLVSVPDVTAYAFNIYPDNNVLTRFTTGSPEAIEPIGTAAVSGSFISGADFIGDDFTTLYGVQNGSFDFVTVDVNNAQVTVIGTSTPADAQSESWTGFSYCADDGQLYASTYHGGNDQSYLYTINAADGTATLVGAIKTGLIIGIAANADGEIYGLDLADVLVRIDRFTGAGTDVGNVGFDANFAQGMEFDDENNILYLAAWNNTLSRSELRVADLETGATTLLGTIGDGTAEYDGLALATHREVDKWVRVDTNSVTCAAGRTASFHVILDATDLTTLGTYTAECRISGNFANEPLEMPIQMDLVAPVIEVTPEAVDFGIVELDTVTQTVVRVANEGLLSLDVTSTYVTNYSSGDVWLSMDYAGGTIASGAWEDVTLTADVTGMAEDVYSGTLVFISNDPSRPEVEVPVDIEVIPEPASILFVLAGLALLLRRR